MRVLTIRDLKPYLGLKLDFIAIAADNGKPAPRFDEMIGLIEANGEEFVIGKIGLEYPIAEVTPLLRSFDSITHEIKDPASGRLFFPYKELLAISYPNVYFSKISQPQLTIDDSYSIEGTTTDGECEKLVIHDNMPFNPVYIVDCLQMWHFDTSGLLKSGLAMPISTIGQEEDGTVEVIDIPVIESIHKIFPQDGSDQ